MAILSNNGIGGFSGKTGGLVGYQLNGRTIIRSIGVRKKKPSAAEKANRAKFALTQLWLRPLLKCLRIGFRNYAPTFQGFVAAKSYTSKVALQQKEDGSYFVDPALVQISYGNIPLPPNLEMVFDGKEVAVTWGNDNLDNDYVMLIVYSPESMIIFGDTVVAKRHDRKATVLVGPVDEGVEFHVYIAFVAYDQSAQSHSRYLGSITR